MNISNTITPLVLTTSLAVALSVTHVAAQLPTIPPGLDATAATADAAVHGGTANHALAVFGVSSELQFVPAGRLVQDRDTGTARLTGRVVDVYDSNEMFDVDVTFTGLTEVAPPSSPKKELNSGAYIENGGTVDTSTYYYYTSFDGTLTGVGAWAGSRLRVSPRGPAMQVGEGASGKNALYGFSAWFDYVVEQQPDQGSSWNDGTGDFNINLNADCLCAVASAPDAGFSTDADTGAVTAAVAFGCDTGWDPVSEAVLDVDIAAGTARITGELAAQSDPSCRLCIDLTLSNRSAPGDASYPPAGLPFLANILPAGLMANGGPADPAHWIYYQSISGVLIGKGSLAGAQVSVTGQPGGAGQLGVGTARNAQLGFLAPLSLTVDQQPTSGPLLADADATIALQLGQCPNPVFMPLGAGPMPTLPSVTQNCYTLHGCGLDTITRLQFGPDVITSQDPCDFGVGYFEIVDANTLKFCPPLCLPAGPRDLVGSDAGGAASLPYPLQIVEPTEPTLACADQLPVGCSQSLYVYGGPDGPYGYCLFVSGSNLPSAIPGLVSLEIGNNFTNFIAFDGAGANCFEQVIGVIPPVMDGLTLYFEYIVIDEDNVVIPLPTTNACGTTYGS